MIDNEHQIDFPKIIDKQHEQVSSAKSSDPGNQYHFTNSKRTIFWLYLFSLLVFIILIIALLSASWTSVQQFTKTDNFYYANQVTYEWKQGYINDLIVTNQTSCPQSYEHALNYKWVGTNYGCLCQPIVNITFVVDGYCTPSLIARNCKNMARQQSFTTHYWTNQANICIKRSSVSFLTEQKYLNSNTQKLCGNANGLVVVPKSQNCPLVNVSFNEVNLQTNYRLLVDSQNLLDPLYGTFNATSPYSFYMYPISYFSVSEHQFCLIADDTGLDPQHTDFVLLLKQRGCAQQGNSSTIATILQKIFYQNNPKLNSLSLIPGFPQPGNWQYHLGFTSLPSWKYQCRHNMDLKFKIQTAIQMFNFQFGRYGHNQASIVTTVFVSVIAVQLLYLLLRRIFHNQVYPTGYKQLYLPYDFILSSMRYIVDLVCKLIILGCVSYLSWMSIYNWSWFKSASNQNCIQGNPQMNQYIINPYTQLYLELVKFSVAKLTICIFFLLIDVIHFRHIYKTELKYYLVTSQGQKLVAEEDKDNEVKYQAVKNNKDLINDYMSGVDKWMKVQLHHNDNLEMRDLAEQQDSFRVTMAMKMNKHEQQPNDRFGYKAKTKMKKKKRRIRDIIQEQLKEDDQEIKQEEQKNNQAYIQDSMLYPKDDNPFMLHDQSLFLESSMQKIYDDRSFQFSKKQRRRR